MDVVVHQTDTVQKSQCAIDNTLLGRFLPLPCRHHRRYTACSAAHQLCEKRSDYSSHMESSNRRNRAAPVTLNCTRASSETLSRASWTSAMASISRLNDRSPRCFQMTAIAILPLRSRANRVSTRANSLSALGSSARLAGIQWLLPTNRRATSNKDSSTSVDQRHTVCHARSRATPRNTLPSSVDKVRLHSIDVTCLKVSCALLSERQQVQASIMFFVATFCCCTAMTCACASINCACACAAFTAANSTFVTAKLDRTSFLSSPDCKTDQTRRKTISRLPNPIKRVLALATWSATNQLLQIVVHGDIIRKILYQQCTKVIQSSWVISISSFTASISAN